MMLDDCEGKTLALPGLPFPDPAREKITACTDWSAAWNRWYLEVILTLDSLLPTYEEFETEYITFAQLEMYASTYVRVIECWLRSNADRAAKLNLCDTSHDFRAGKAKVNPAVVKLLLSMKYYTVEVVLKRAYIPCGVGKENEDLGPRDQDLYPYVLDMRQTLDRVQSLRCLSQEVCNVIMAEEDACNEKLKKA